MSVNRRESARKRAKRPPLRKRAGCDAYMHAINAAPISRGARYLSGVIALNLDEISRLMRDEKECFFEALRKQTCTYDYISQAMRECVDAGILEADTIGGLCAFLPRMPDEARP